MAWCPLTFLAPMYWRQSLCVLLSQPPFLQLLFLQIFSPFGYFCLHIVKMSCNPRQQLRGDEEDSAGDPAPAHHSRGFGESRWAEIMQQFSIALHFTVLLPRESDMQFCLVCDYLSDHKPGFVWLGSCHRLTTSLLEWGPDWGCQYPSRQDRKNKDYIATSPALASLETFGKVQTEYIFNTIGIFKIARTHTLPPLWRCAIHQARV